MDSSLGSTAPADANTPEPTGESVAGADERARLHHTAWADVALRIRAARRALGLTKRALAEEIGVPLPVFVRCESAHGDPGVILDAVSRVTGKPVEWFLGAPAPSSAATDADLSKRLRSLMRTENEFLWRRNELEARARALREAEKRHAAVAGDLQRRETSVRKREAELEKRELEAARESLALEERGAEVWASRESLAGKAQELEDERSALSDREAALSVREEELGRAEAMLAAEAERLDAAEAACAAAADELEARAETLRLAVERVGQEEAELRRRKAAVDRREQALTTTEERTRELLAAGAHLEKRETDLEVCEAALTARRQALERQLDERERAVAEGEDRQVQGRLRLNAAFREHARVVLAQAEQRRSVEERAVELARREAALECRETELNALEEKLERERAELSLARPERPGNRPEPEDDRLDTALLARAVNPRLASGEWRLDALGRLVDQRRGQFPERVAEWEAYLAAIGEHATPAGRVPAQFSHIVAEVFGPLFD